MSMTARPPAVRFRIVIAAALFLGLAPFSTARAQGDAGVRRVETEAARRRLLVLELIPKLVEHDNALITLGFDDPLRHRRINRLFGMQDRLFTAGRESLAVAVACLDLLRSDPGLRRTPIARDLDRAAGYALQSMLPQVPELPAWRELRRSARFEPGRIDAPHPPDPNFRDHPNPFASPTLSNAPRPSGSTVLLETPSRTLPDLDGGIEGFLWIPGTSSLALWGPAGVALVPAARPGPPEFLSRSQGFRTLSVSSSGEYLAGIRRDSGAGRDVLIVFRLAADSSLVQVDSGTRIEQVTFPRRGLGLSWHRDGQVRIIRSPGAEPELLLLCDEVAPRGLGWSPDGRYIMVVARERGAEPAESSPGWTRLVHDVRAGRNVSKRRIQDSFPVAWCADSRSYAALDPVDGRSIVILPVDSTGASPGDVVANVPTGARVTEAAFAASGTTLALLSSAPDAWNAATISSPDRAMDTSDFVRWHSDVTLLPARTSEKLLDPPEDSMESFSWHPGGTWYATTLNADLFGASLWLVDRRSGNAFPAGKSDARKPRFSSDGSRLAWIEGGEPARIVVQDLGPAPVTQAVEESRSAAAALREEKAVAAIRQYRNAARLEPADVRHHTGLGEAYLTVAAGMGDPWQRGYFLEAAARARFAAYEKGSAQPSVRRAFLESMDERAVFAGRRWAEAYRARAEAELDDLPADADLRIDGLTKAAVHLTDAILWDPWEEQDRVLLEGTLVRLGSGAGQEKAGSAKPDGGRPR